jgi:hypothetical protein
VEGAYTHEYAKSHFIQFSADDGAGGYLTGRDVDALLQIEWKYRAFGFGGSGGRLWTIRNGLYNTPDDQPEIGEDGEATGRGVGMGSYIHVKIGEGTLAEKKGQETIIYYGD